MRKLKTSFTTEVHLGLLVIIFILLLLNVVSNYTIFQDRTYRRDHVAAQLAQAAIVISHAAQQNIGTNLDDRNDREFKLAFNLSSIILIPSRPGANDPVTRRNWFASIVSGLPPGQVPDIARKLLTADFQTMTRGENSEYFYVYPVPTSTGKKLLILSMNSPELAYLDDASHTIFMISVISVIVIAMLYLMLYRFILSPFRRIRQQALAAGRSIPAESNDVDSMVAEYEKIIGELREKEAELRRANDLISQRADSLEQFNRYLLASTTSGVIMLDADARIISINDTAKSLIGATVSVEKGRSLDEIGLSNKTLQEGIRIALSQSRAVPYNEYAVLNADGNELQLGVSIGPVVDDRQQMVGISILLNDLTELKQLRAELETSRRLVFLGEMSAGLAHQLRNSIGAILGYASLIKKRLNKDNQDTSSIEALESESHDAEQLVGKFMHFARPFAYDPRPTDLNNLVAEVKEAFDVRTDHPHCHLTLTANRKEQATVILDELLIKQAVTNLVENAANAYDSKGGDIELTLNVNDDQVRIEVSDHGCGISPDKLEQIFTPFYSSRPLGTGLGLPLVRKIVDLHQGRLSVKSEEGRGSTFVITLPIRDTKSMDNRVETIPARV